MGAKLEVNLDGLKKLQKKIKELSQPHEVAFGELFNNNFMSKYTSVSSFDKLLEVSGFEVKSMEDFKAIPDNAWEECIRQYTSFNSWQEMQSKAVGENLKQQLP